MFVRDIENRRFRADTIISFWYDDRNAKVMAKVIDKDHDVCLACYEYILKGRLQNETKEISVYDIAKSKAMEYMDDLEEELILMSPLISISKQLDELNRKIDLIIEGFQVEEENLD